MKRSSYGTRAVPVLPADGVLTDPELITWNLVIAALPHWLLWWVAARRGASRLPEFYGGLLGANVVLGVYTLNDMGLLWFFYWPLAAVAIVLGHGTAASVTERWPSRRFRR